MNKPRLHPTTPWPLTLWMNGIYYYTSKWLIIFHLKVKLTHLVFYLKRVSFHKAGNKYKIRYRLICHAYNIVFIYNYIIYLFMQGPMKNSYFYYFVLCNIDIHFKKLMKQRISTVNCVVNKTEYDFCLQHFIFLQIFLYHWRHICVILLHNVFVRTLRDRQHIENNIK